MTANSPSRRQFSFAHLLLLVPWVALVIDAWRPIIDNSFLWHIRAGSLQRAKGEVLTEDPFSFTELGESWLTQSWLAELGYDWAESSVSGLGFVPLMLLATTLVAFVGIGLVAWQYSRGPMSTALVLLLSVLVMISFLVPRPVIFSFALFPLVMLAWANPRWRWTLPFLFWVWASVHGSFAIGLAYVGLMLIAEKEWRWLPTAVVTGIATLFTAHGLGVLTMLVDFGEARETLRLLVEWRRPSLTSPTFLPFVVGVVLIGYGFMSKRLRPSYLLVVLPFVALGFTAMRAVPPAWLALTPFVAQSVSFFQMGEKPRFSRPAAVVFALVVLVFPFLLTEDAQLDQERFPIDAALALENTDTFHDDVAGGYLIWAMGPEFLVYIDDRAELYQNRIAEFAAVRDLHEPWEPVFERDGISQVLLRSDEELVVELTAAGWSIEYEDDEFVVLR